jgi:hypothetical protein
MGFSGNGVALVSGHADGVIRVWDTHALIHVPDAIMLFKDIKLSPDTAGLTG